MSLPKNVYRTKNPDTREHNGYRVLFQHNNKTTSKSFPFSKYGDSALDAATDFVEEFRTNYKRINCSTGIVGVIKTFNKKGKFTYYYYVAHWRAEVGGRQYVKSFQYAVKNSEDGSFLYDADLELRAFRCAIHFRYVAKFYKDLKLGKKFLKRQKKYFNLDNWATVGPERIFYEKGFTNNVNNDVGDFVRSNK